MTNWIKVTDRLPEPDKHRRIWCLVYAEFNENRNLGIIHIAEYRKGRWHLLESRVDDRCVEDYFETVTHWMPLPDEPKKENLYEKNNT